jgi:hypothetical protein
VRSGGGCGCGVERELIGRGGAKSAAVASHSKARPARLEKRACISTLGTYSYARVMQVPAISCSQLRIRYRYADADLST